MLSSLPVHPLPSGLVSHSDPLTDQTGDWTINLQGWPEISQTFSLCCSYWSLIDFQQEEVKKKADWVSPGQPLGFLQKHCLACWYSPLAKAQHNCDGSTGCWVKRARLVSANVLIIALDTVAFDQLWCRLLLDSISVMSLIEPKHSDGTNLTETVFLVRLISPCGIYCRLSLQCSISHSHQFIYQNQSALFRCRHIMLMCGSIQWLYWWLNMCKLKPVR